MSLCDNNYVCIDGEIAIWEKMDVGLGVELLLNDTLNNLGWEFLVNFYEKDLLFLIWLRNLVVFKKNWQGYVVLIIWNISDINFSRGINHGELCNFYLVDFFMKKIYCF